MENNLISTFATVTSKNPILIDITLFYDRIKNGEYRAQVEAVREAVSRGDKNEANQLKRKLAYNCLSGEFQNGHKATDLVRYNQRMPLDYDNLPPELIEELKQMLAREPYVECVFVSPSGNGLKAVVCTDGTAEQHTLGYTQVADHVDQLTRQKCDRACKDICRGHFTSYDPGLLYKVVTEPFHIVDTTTPQTPAIDLTPPAIDYQTTTTQRPQTPSAIDLVRSFLTLNPAPEGDRNTTLFRMACQFFKRGIPREELIQTAIQLMEEESFDTAEIRQDVNSAYSYMERKNEGVKWQDSGKMPVTVPECAFQEEEEEENIGGEHLRDHSACLPDEIFGLIPEFLQTAVRHFTDLRERDMILLSSLTVLSSCMHTTYGRYAQKKIYPNLFFFVVAPPASNKGVIEFALDLLEHYTEEINARNKKLEDKYNEEVETYEKSLRKKPKEGEVLPKKPIPPAYIYPRTPSTTSRSRLIDHLIDNGEYSTLIADLEADTITTATQKEHGQFLDMLRNIAHHEAVMCSYKNEGKPKIKKKPKASLLLAGTPAQQFRYTPTTENGLFSRSLYYTHGQNAVWKDVSPGEDERLLERTFDELSMRLKRMLDFLHASPTKVTFSKQQWSILNDTYAALLKENLLSDRQDFNGCIKRHALTAYRICMILTMLDKGALRMDVPEMECSDSNFRASMLITTTCLEHARLLITGIKDADKDTPELQNPDKFKIILSRMQKRFTTKDFKLEAEKVGLNKWTVPRLLKNAIGVVIKKMEHGVYQKIK